MAKTLSSLQDKQQSHIKIGNFYIKKKTLIIVGVIALILFIIIKYNNAQKQKELEARILAANQQPYMEEAEETVMLSLDEQIQAQLRQQYGEPPEGFRWNYVGELEAIPDIEDKTAEDVVYTYLESLHMMDLATAQRVAAKSSIIDLVNSYYTEANSVLLNEQDDFQRKLLRLALDKMQVNGITNTIVQADGTYIFTVEITCLDLTNKNFWRQDEQELYQTMFVYDKTETDTYKKNIFLYDYIYDAYEKELCGFKTNTADIVVGKANSGGWLVKDDYALKKLILYEDGLGLFSYILTQYQDWFMDKQYSGGNTAEDKVGFGYSTETYVPDPEATGKSTDSTTNQQLQYELEYYKEHGELPPKNQDTSTTDTETTDTETTNESMNTSTPSTTEETTPPTANTSAEQSSESSKINILPLWDGTEEHSQSEGEQRGYGISN